MDAQHARKLRVYDELPDTTGYIITKRCARCGHANCVIFESCQSCQKALGPARCESAEGADGPIPNPLQQGTRALLARISREMNTSEFLSLTEKETTVGRESGEALALDPYVMPKHCHITLMPDGALVEDVSQACGIFIETAQEGTTLRAGDLIRIGDQLLRFEMRAGLPDHAHLCCVAGSLPEDWSRQLSNDAPTTIGRSRGDIILPKDERLAAEHCRLERQGQSFLLRDLGSQGGTYIRERGASFVGFGGRLYIGQLLFTLVDGKEVIPS